MVKDNKFGNPSGMIGPNKKNGQGGGNLRPRGKFDEKAKKRFLELSLEHGPHNHRHAYAVGVSPATEVNHRKKDKEYAAAYDDMMEQWKQKVEAEVIRRAMEGVEEPVFFQGKVVGQVRKHSDNLLLSLMRRYDPENWVERNQMDLNVAGGVLVVSQKLSPEEWAAKTATPIAHKEVETDSDEAV